jgi:stage II sporulation protein D
VRTGEFKERTDAQALAGRLSRSGLPGAFVVEEAAPAGAFHLRLLETGDDLLGAAIVPARTGDILAVDATPYRGYFEVRSVKEGTLTVVNVVHVEDYLRGVVPNELSPEAFPEEEALKAQAVAARTYALKNRGEWSFKGYDICATAACQVYKGRATEHRVTDKVIEETRGIVVTWQGSYINAFYTSTCGGHTEDGENVLEEKARPYLRGVVCAPERTAWAAIRTTAAPRSFADQDGLSRDAALLVALGILEPKAYAAAALSGSATEAELQAWTKRLVQSLNRRSCPTGPEPGPLGRRGHFFRHLVESLCWQERAERLLSPGDPEYLLRLEDGRDLADAERTAAALLIEEGILSPFPDNTLRPAAALTRAQAVKLLARAAERAGAPGLVIAEFHGVAEGLLTVVEGGAESERAYQLDPAVRLFRDLEGVRAAASELRLAVGDQVRYVLGDSGRVAFLEGQQSRKGVAADRDSRYYRWEVRMTPAEVARAVTRYGTVAQVRDVVARRVGVSGRVVELAVLGSQNREELVLRGLKVRFGLGLRENLFVIDRETDAQGAVKRFVFTGKGWGHGVGLCQVGAFGMARSGSAFESILKHYYTGVELKQAY